MEIQWLTVEEWTRSCQPRNEQDLQLYMHGSGKLTCSRLKNFSVVVGLSAFPFTFVCLFFSSITSPSPSPSPP